MLHQFLFQPDNAPWYTSKLIRSRIEVQHFNMLSWAPQSPDLNHIDTCGILSKANLAN